MEYQRAQIISDNSGNPFHYDPSELVKLTANALKGLKTNDETQLEYVETIDLIDTFISPVIYRDLKIDNNNDSIRALQALDAITILNRQRLFDINQKMINIALGIYQLVTAINTQAPIGKPAPFVNTSSVFMQFIEQKSSTCDNVFKLHQNFCNVSGYSRPLKKRIQQPDDFIVQDVTDLIPFVNKYCAQWDHLVLQSRDINLGIVLSTIGYIGLCYRNGETPHYPYFEEAFKNTLAGNDDYHHIMAADYSEIMREHNRLHSMGDDLVNFARHSFPRHQSHIRDRHSFNIKTPAPKP